MVFSSPICRTDDNSVYILHSSLLSDRKLNLAVYHVLYYRKEGNTLNKECGPVPLLGEHFRNDSIHIRCSRCSVHFLFCAPPQGTLVKTDPGQSLYSLVAPSFYYPLYLGFQLLIISFSSLLFCFIIYCRSGKNKDKMIYIEVKKLDTPLN